MRKKWVLIFVSVAVTLYIGLSLIYASSGIHILERVEVVTKWIENDDYYVKFRMYAPESESELYGVYFDVKLDSETYYRQHEKQTKPLLITPKEFWEHAGADTCYVIDMIKRKFPYSLSGKYKVMEINNNCPMPYY